MESALSRYGGSEKPIMKLKAFFTICFIVSDIYVYTQFHMVAQSEICCYSIHHQEEEVKQNDESYPFASNLSGKPIAAGIQTKWEASDSLNYTKVTGIK